MKLRLGKVPGNQQGDGIRPAVEGEGPKFDEKVGRPHAGYCTEMPHLWCLTAVAVCEVLSPHDYTFAAGSATMATVGEVWEIHRGNVSIC